MDNKFYGRDISKFDPTNASAEDIRKWLFAIIDAELEKCPEERDYDLIEECSEFEAELPSMDIELSGSEYVAGLERIKALTPATENKETKILKPKKKTKKSVRIIAILAASIAALLLSLSVAASAQRKTVLQFISDNIRVILGMNTGDKLEEGNITLIKYGESFYYSSVEEAVSDIEYNILYPSYLPEGVKIEKIVVTDNGHSGVKIIFSTNINNLWINITNQIASYPENMKEITPYNNGNIDFYVFSKFSNYQAIGWYKNMEYNIMYNNYDEMIKILDGIKEIDK